MATLQIKIKSDGRVVDTHCRKTLSKSAGDSVRWVAVGEGTWTVNFPNGSPFASSTFENISPDHSVSSGPVTGEKGQSYKYDVKSASTYAKGKIVKGKITDDPDILVDD